MTLQEPNQQTHEIAQANPIRYVDELEGENDYWMSLTDAARITRTSEPMVRRWVTTGRLPVKREPAGINQRTRLIRASDLALLRPIVDPTAAITDDIHKLDLLSIPRQQARILQDQQQLQEQMQEIRQAGEQGAQRVQAILEESVVAQGQQQREWNERFSSQQAAWQEALDLQQEHQNSLSDRVEQINGEMGRAIDELKRRGAQQQHDLELLRVTLTNQFQEALSAQQDAQQELRRRLEHLDQDVQQRQAQLSQEFTAQLKQREEHFQNALTELLKKLAQYSETQQSMQEVFLAHLQELRGHVQQAMESELGVMKRALDEFSDELASMQKTQEQNIQNIWQAAQQRIDAQEVQMKTLAVMLQEEQVARQTLSEQMRLQSEHLQVLERELESLRKNYQNPAGR